MQSLAVVSQFQFPQPRISIWYVASYLPMGQGNSTSEQLRRESTEPRKRKRESYDHCSQIRDSPLGISVWDIVDLAG